MKYDNQKYQLHLKEVEDRLRKTASTTPARRAAFRQKYSFSHLPFEEHLPIWDHIWKNAPHDLVRLYPFFFCESIMTKEELLRSSWDTIVTWQDEISNWWLCDAMSKIYTKNLELEPKKVYQTLKKWNKDSDLWKRRQSIVSLLYYTGTKKAILPFEDIKALIHPLLEDKEYYVQKAVGWSLRELHTAYPKEGYAYLSDNIKKVSGIAFSPATEKLSVENKQLLKDKRR